MDGRVEGWMEGWIDMGMDECMGRSMDGCMEGMDGFGAKNEAMTTTRCQFSDGKSNGSMVWAFHRHCNHQEV